MSDELIREFARVGAVLAVLGFIALMFLGTVLEDNKRVKEAKKAKETEEARRAERDKRREKVIGRRNANLGLSAYKRA